jgi:hypothetical protein
MKFRNTSKGNEQLKETPLTKRWNYPGKPTGIRHTPQLYANHAAAQPPNPPMNSPYSLDNVLRLHEGLTKAQSSLLVPARTGAIGLRDFLFKVKAHRVPTPYYCDCGTGKRTGNGGTPSSNMVPQSTKAQNLEYD